MPVGFDSLHQAVVAKLNTLVGSGQVLKVVYAYHETAPAGFPAASCEPSGNANLMYTTGDNLRSYAFDIILYQEFSTITREAAVAILRAAVDAVIEAFDADYNLSGACDYANALPSEWGFMEGANGSTLWASLALVCNYEADVT